VKGPLAGWMMVVVALSACGVGSSSEQPTFVQRDSAGVRIVESRRPAWSASDAWTVSPTPALQIGVVDGDPHYQFFRIAGVRRLSNGEIVVADGGSHTIRWYDGAGRFVQSVGGPGEGPEEYQWLGSMIVLPGDSILAEDRARYRMSLYDASGQRIRSWVIQPMAPFLRPAPIGRLAESHFIVLTEYDSSPGPGYVRNDAVIARYLDGAVVDTIAHVPGGESYHELCGPQNMGLCNIRVAFGVRIHASVSRSRIVVGNGEEYQVSVFDPTGALKAVYRRLIPREKLPDAWVTQYIDSIVGVQLPQRQPEVRRQLEAAPRREYLPAFTDLMLDQLGCLWVAREIGPGETTRPWDVFDPGGRLLGPVILPAGLQVTQIDREYVLGIRRDANAVEYVVLHQLMR
jgi:hypothetical protein